MKVLVYGAGSVGFVFSALLARRGHQVSIVTRERHLPALQTEGIKLTGAFGNHLVRVAESVSKLSELSSTQFDLILITVKSYDTREAAQALKPLAKAKTVFISLQNGMGNLEIIEKVIGKKNLLASSCLMAAQTTGPATVRVTSALNELRIGGFSKDMPHNIAARIAIEMNEAGIETKVSNNMESDLWAKLIMNAAVNPLTALQERKVGELVKKEGNVVIMNALIEELFLLASSLKIELPWTDPEAFRETLFQTLLPAFSHHEPSMLRDIQNGRRTEIDSLNGYVVALARRHGIATPVNAYITDLVQKKEFLWRRTA